VCASSKNRRTSWKDIPRILGWNCFVYAIETAFKRKGFSRRIALKKPLLTDAYKRARLDWAEAHKHWTWEDWKWVFWTDETWVNPGRHKKVRVTRRAGEVLHLDCVEPKVRKRIGWMFWGGISGAFGRGPGLFWEKSWGTITAESYSSHVVPVIGSYTYGSGLIFMQDNAAGHKAEAIIAEMARWGIRPIYWPANSLDLNPIETVWDWIKDYVEKKDLNIHRNYRRLREAVIEAWESITNEQIRELIATMLQRCQDVINAQGGHTKW
jgi:hypothetical protein